MVGTTLVELPAGVAMIWLLLVPLLSIDTVNNVIYVELEDLSVEETWWLCSSMLSPVVRCWHTTGVWWGMLRFFGSAGAVSVYLVLT